MGKSERVAWFATGVAASVATAAVLGQVAPRGGELVVESLTVRDAQGQERIILETLPDGSAAITLADEHGRDRIMLYSLSENVPDPAGSRAVIAMLDAEDRNRINIATSNAGHATLSVLDTRENGRFTVGTTPDGRAATIHRAADGSIIRGTP